MALREGSSRSYENAQCPLYASLTDRVFASNLSILSVVRVIIRLRLFFRFFEQTPVEVPPSVQLQRNSENRLQEREYNEEHSSKKEADGYPPPRRASGKEGNE